MTKVLVTFASTHGATAEIARAIADVLRLDDLIVDVRRVELVKRLPDYDAVIFGSAIYIGEWLPVAQDFLTRHAAVLQMQHVWLFSSGPTGDGKALDLLNGAKVPECMQPIVNQIDPRDVTVFHGKLDLRRLTKSERIIVKAANAPKGDFRNWNTIKSWAQQIADALKVAGPNTTREVTLIAAVD